MEIVAQVASGHRADIDLPPHGVADLERLHMGAESLHESICDALLDDQALGCDAALSDIQEATPGGDGGGFLHVRVGEHDEGIRSAQFQHLLLEQASGLARHQTADFGGACQSHCGNPRIGDDALDGGSADQKRLEQPLRCSRFPQNLLNGERALRHVAGMFQDGPIARGEGRS
jgi:hypothetical protein